MNMDASLAIASGALSTIGNQFAVISQNVANASTTDYATEVATQTNRTADGEAMGVITGATTRAVDDALQGELYQQNAVVAGLQATQTALAGIDTVPCRARWRPAATCPACSATCRMPSPRWRAIHRARRSSRRS
jgi:flagellar hook-associated protein 1 FlgK